MNDPPVKKEPQYKMVEFQCGCGCWVRFIGKPKEADSHEKDGRCTSCSKTKQ